MIKSLLTYFLLTSILLLASCKSATKNNDTYFGGKIINPKSNFVVLYSMDKVVDTMFLGKDNKFLGTLKNTKEGLYYFVHGNENQYIYLEPQDSLMLRLNTWDFDESIVFAGKGAERNNILIDCFLEDEKENKMFYNLYKLDAATFLKKTDSLLIKKEKTYQDYVSNHSEETANYKHILKIALTYPIYSRIERYPIANLKYHNYLNLSPLDDQFFKHRVLTNIENDSLMYYPPYTQYVRNFLYNSTYKLGHKPMLDEYSSEFTVDLLNIISENIKSNSSKNAFLKQTVIGHFFKKASCNINEETFNTYFKLSNNVEDKNLVANLLKDAKTLHKGLLLPNFEVYNFKNETINSHQIIKNNDSFLFFWNPEYVSPSYISSRIGYLSKKLPNIKFVTIRIDGNINSKIANLDVKNQFFITSKNSANSFLTSKMPRSILINNKGIITNGFSSITSKNLTTELATISKH